ncbi:MAG: alkaline phosphatase family protein, partial [Pseudomonadota bacterium]|nr:alkaline phosphatase family protein [Pseudomonadota bacterium]
HLNKGEYLASFFDVAHDFGFKTALFASKDKFDVYLRSYDAAHGAVDEVGEDNGRQKIDSSVATDYDDQATLARFLSAMNTTPLPHLTLLHFSNPDQTGHDFIWDVTPNSAYMNKVKELDGFLQQVLNAIPAATTVIVIADHGGGEPINSHSNKTASENYTIPFIVWNNINTGISPGSDLYALNQDNGYLDPGNARVDYQMPVQPIRNGDVGNLALSLLCLPPIPGSSMGQTNTLALTSTTAPQFNHTNRLNLTPIQVDDTRNPGTSVDALTADLITSAKGCPINNIAVVEVNNTHGSWQYSTDNGSSWVFFNQPSESQARLLTATDRIRFLPQPGYQGVVTPGLRFRAWDRGIGQYQGTANTVYSGDNSPFSQAIATAQITVGISNTEPPPIDNPELPIDETPTQPQGSSAQLYVPPATVNLNITVAGSGQGRVLSQPQGINCHNFTQNHCPPTHRSDFVFHCLPKSPSRCQHEFKQHPTTQVELIPEPGPDAVFLGWGLDEACALGPLTMIKDRYCLAYFAALHTLTVRQAGSGSGRIVSYNDAHQPNGIDCGGYHQICSQRFRDQHRVILEVLPAPGAVFQKWTGDCHGKTQSILVPMDTAKHCVAVLK